MAAGLRFLVADGRCTRGAYGSLLRLPDHNEVEYIMFVDTEGLGSVTKAD
jgi:hypothetical protein